MANLQVNGIGRPSNIKHPSAPSLMMNAHFAPVGADAEQQDYEHGIQVIDEDKLFKYALSSLSGPRHATECLRLLTPCAM